jgi:hypothetical protein
MIMNNKIRNDVETIGTDLSVSTMQTLTDGADECLEKLRFQIKPEKLQVQNSTGTAQLFSRTAKKTPHLTITEINRLKAVYGNNRCLQ